jgi:hypothetical protein
VVVISHRPALLAGADAVIELVGGVATEAATGDAVPPR